MKKTLRFSLLFLAWFSLIPVSARPAAPAPGKLKWRFPAGREELSLAAAGDTEFTVSIGGAIEYCCPAIAADSTVYFGSHNGCLYAINPDGTLIWQFWTGGKIMKSPVIDTDGTVYIGSDDNYLYALDPQGRQKWRHHAASWFSSPALGADGSLYAGTGDGYLYALDHDGNFKWRFHTGKYPKTGAVGSDGTIYIGTWLYDQSHNMFYAVNPDGSLKWSYPLSGEGCTTPAIGADGTIYFTSRTGCLIALNPDGSEQWSYRTGGKLTAAPVIAGDGTIYFGSNDGLFYAVNPDGTHKWSCLLGLYGSWYGDPEIPSEDLDDCYTLPVSVNGSAAVGADGTIYFGATDHNFYALSRSGEHLWTFPTAGDINCSPAIDRSGTIYFGSMDRNLYALDSGTGAGLDDSPWPKYLRDMVNSGRAGHTGVHYGVLSVDSVLTAFDSSFTVGIGYQAFQATAAVEFSLIFDNQCLRLDSVCLTGRTRDMTILALDLDSAKVSGRLDISLVDLTLSGPLTGGTGKLVEIHFTETGNIAQVLELKLSGCSGSTDEGAYLVLRSVAGKVIIKRLLKSCDINEDGFVNVADLISLLLKIRAEPANDDWDWNDDGVASIADVVSLLLDMRRGECPDFGPGLASSTVSAAAGQLPALNRAELAYLEEALAELPLTADEQAAFRLALYGRAAAAELPRAFSLEQNVPNPFNPATTISYSVPEGSAGRVALKVYDIRGTLVRVLVDEAREAGTYTVFWDGTDRSGERLASGVYFYRLQAGGFLQTRKMVLLK